MSASTETTPAVATAPPPLTQVLRELAEAAPEAPAVTCAGRTTTRGQLDDRANQLARAYEKLGVTSGDTVALALPNGIELFEATLAVWKLGGVPLPLSYRFPVHERREIVELADAKLVVGVDAADHPGRATVPVGYQPDSALSTAALETDQVSPSWQITTSGGSTGRPKLIVSLFSSEIAPQIAQGLASHMGMPAGAGVVLVPSPLYHGAGFQWAWSSLMLGNHTVVLPKFDAVEALEAITRFGVDWVFFVPTMMSRMFRALEAEPTRFKLDSLKALWHGAGPCPAWVKEAWIDLLGPEKVMELYGAGEANVGSMITGVEWLEHRGSVGKPVGGEVRAFAPDGTELPTGEVGELYMKPVEGAPQKAKVVGADIKQRDGWTTVGDLGWLDEDGYLYISDRRVDMIVSGGANVYPAEVEAALMEHPLVASAIVVGLPDDDLGQRVHAVVEVTGAITEQDVLGFLADRLVRYKIPRSLRLVTEPLRDDADKARRSTIRDQEIELMKEQA